MSAERFAEQVARLAARYGEPRRVTAEVRGRFDPISNPRRAGEVCMVVRRPNGRLLISIKTFYPRSGWRLPTGGIERGEDIEAALLRETHEETGLETRIERFLAAVDYERPADGVVFHTYAFLLAELSGTLGSLDEHEQIEAYREIEIADLPRIADTLDGIGRSAAPEIAGDWADWGRFRAIVHREVHAALAGPPAAASTNVRGSG